MGLQKKSKIMVQSFFLFFFILCVPLSVIASVNIGNRIHREKQEYENRLERTAGQISDSVRAKLLSISRSAASLFSSQWYSHWRAPLNLYDSEFTQLRRMEISASIAATIIPMEFVCDILVVTPEMDSVISRHGFYTMEQYSDYYKRVFLSGDGKELRVSTHASEYGFYVIDDIYSRVMSGKIVVILDNKLFAQYMAQFTDWELRSLSVEIGGQTIFQFGGNADGFRMEKQLYTGTPTSIQFVYSNYAQLYVGQNQKDCLMWLAIVILLSVIGGVVLTVVTARPLEKFLKYLPGNYRSFGDVYRSMSEYVEALALLNSRLKSENQTLKTSLEQNRELPLSFQIQFLSKLQALHMDECLLMIEERQDTYEPEMFFAFLNRMIRELNPEIQERLSGYFEEGARRDYRRLSDLTFDIIKILSVSKHRNSFETVRQIRQYIDENFRDQNMSIKLLSGRFEMDGAQISRMFKAETGQNFSDYLLALRMGCAREMMAQKELSLNKISQNIGFENYLTFKRSFVRFYGVNPKDYPL